MIRKFSDALFDGIDINKYGPIWAGNSQKGQTSTGGASTQPTSKNPIVNPEVVLECIPNNSYNGGREGVATDSKPACPELCPYNASPLIDRSALKPITHHVSPVDPSYPSKQTPLPEKEGHHSTKMNNINDKYPKIPFVETPEFKKILENTMQNMDKIMREHEARKKAELSLSKSRKGCGFDAEISVMDLSMTVVSKSQNEYRVEEEWKGVENALTTFVEESLNEENDFHKDFFVFRSDSNPNKITEITRDNAKVWRAVCEVAEAINSSPVAVPTAPMTLDARESNDEIAKLIMSGAMQGLYKGNTFHAHERLPPTADSFQISGTYKDSVKNSLNVLKSLGPNSKGTSSSVSKIHEIFANSMAKYSPYRLSGTCGNICEGNVCQRTSVKFPSNVHILTSSHVEIPELPESRFHRVSLYSDGYFDSFVLRHF